MWWLWVVAMAGDWTDWTVIGKPMPDDVQFFARTLVSPGDPPDSTLAFGAQRQGMFVSPDRIAVSWMDMPPGPTKRPGIAHVFEVPLAQFVSASMAEGCVEVKAKEANHRVCLDAAVHHPLAVDAALKTFSKLAQKQ